MKIKLGSLHLSKEWRLESTSFLPRSERPGICRTCFEFFLIFKPGIIDDLHQLLLRPDEKDLVGVKGIGRGSTLRHEGDEGRFRRWLPIRMRAIRASEFARFGMELPNAE